MAFEKGFYKDLLDHIYTSVYFVDIDRRISFWNKSAEELTGYSAAEVVGKRCADNILVHVDEQGEQLCNKACPAAKAMADGQPCETQVYLHHKQGHRIPILVRTAPVRNADGKIVGAVESFIDNSGQKELAEHAKELEKLALVDELTGIANRRYGETQLEARFNELQRYGWPFGLLFLDIDHFKNINDEFGHDVGDRVLKMVAKTVARSIRSFDTVCRWGGEEFLVILANIDDAKLFEIAEKIRVLVAKSFFDNGDRAIKTTISAGATLAEIGDTIESIVKRVDELMYRSKTTGRNKVTSNVSVQS